MRNIYQLPMNQRWGYVDWPNIRVCADASPRWADLNLWNYFYTIFEENNKQDFVQKIQFLV